MKNLTTLALAAFYCLFFLPTSNAQTSSKQRELQPYDDADGYGVLSFIIDGRASRLKSESVSIFRNTISERDLREIKDECSGKIPEDFKAAAENLGNKAKTKFRLQQKLLLQKKYSFASAPVAAKDEALSRGTAGVFSVSVVGFDQTKTHAIALVEYLVRRTGSIAVGGDSTFYLLRKTEKGWQEATEVPKCGRIY